MKIMYISGSYPPIRCGVGDYLYSLLQEMKEDVFVLSSKGAQPGPGILPIIQKWDIGAWSPLLKSVRSFRPDVIHVQYPSIPYGRSLFVNLIPLLLKYKFRDTPLVVTLHEFHDASILGKIRALFTTLGSDKVIVTNTESERELTNLIGSKIVNIPIGSNIPIARAGREELDATASTYNPEGKKLVLYFGFIDPSKGVDELIRAASQYADMNLVIATDEDSSNPFHRSLRKKVNQTQNVSWTGFLDKAEISKLMQIADAAVLPFDKPASLRRGSLLAAISHGLPVITTGPVSPPLINEENCLTIADNSPQNIKKCLERLFESRSLNKMLRVNSAELAKLFDWEDIANKHLEIYSYLLQKKS